MINMTIIDSSVPSNGGSDVNISSADGPQEHEIDFFAIMSEDALQTDLTAEEHINADKPSIDMLFNTPKTPKPSMPMLGIMTTVQNTDGPDAQIIRQTEGEVLFQAEHLTSMDETDPFKITKTDINSRPLTKITANPLAGIKTDIAGLQEHMTPSPAPEIVVKDSLEKLVSESETTQANNILHVPNQPTSAKDIKDSVQLNYPEQQPVTKDKIENPKAIMPPPANSPQNPVKLDQRAPVMPEMKKLVDSSGKDTFETIPAVSSEQNSEPKTAGKTDQPIFPFLEGKTNTVDSAKPLKIFEKPLEYSKYSSLPKDTNPTVKHNNEIESEKSFYQPVAPAAKPRISTEQPLFISQTSEAAPAEKLTNEMGPFAGLSEVSAPIAAKTYADTSVHRPEMARHVAQQLADVARHMPDRPIELSLNPEELGRVRMTFTLTDGGINVAVMTERGETMDLLRRNIETLAQEFRELGHKDVKFNFSSNNQESSQQNGAGDDVEITSETELSEKDQIEPARISLDQSSGLDIRL